MRNKADLFHLIQSMSKSEKRYFVLDAKKGGRTASRYLALFDALNGLEDYKEETEAALQAQFSKNLSSDKAYLYEAILRSMRDYRSPSSKAAQVKERLMDARYLHERGLYEQSTGRIMEAKAMAVELEDQFTLMEINKEEQVSLFDRKATVQVEHIEKLKEERGRTLEATHEEATYLDLYSRLLAEVRREFNLKDERSIEALKKRLPLELLEEAGKPKSPQALRRYHLCNAVWHNLLADNEMAFHHFLQAAEWWDGFPALKHEEYHRYIIDVTNLVNTSYRIEKYFQVAKDWVERMNREKEGRSYHNQKSIFLQLSMASLLHLLNQNNFIGASKVLPDIIDGLDKFNLTKSAALTGNIATVYFLVKDYRQCIYWAEHIIKSIKTGGREDIQRLVRLYKVISHFELGEVDMAETSMKSAQRYFKSQGLPKDRFENVVLNVHLKNIFNSPLSEVKTHETQFTQYLENLRTKPQAGSALGVDELAIWIQSRKR